MCRLIFLGPSLDVETARGILEDAIYLPPLRQGDLIGAIDRYHPWAVGIVDGYFLQDLPVWHKEILLALQRGTAVYGSSSMGALRAAEMAAYGMRGIGQVYRDFSSGALTDDDEVALAHGPAELGYAKLSEPMVNVRATLQAALERGAITAETLHGAERVAKAMHFTERNLPQMLNEWTRAGLPSKAMEDCFRFHYVDVKRRDAIELVSTMAAAELTRPSPRPDLDAPHSLAFDTLYHRDRRGRAGLEMSSIFRFAATHMPDFENLRFEALNRTLTELFAANLGIIATPAQIEEETRRFRSSRGLQKDHDFQTWLQESDLTEEEFGALAAGKATCRQLQEWWLSVASGHGQRVKAVLDELKLSDSYRNVARGAAELAELTAETPKPDVHAWTRTEVAALVRTHAAETGFRLDIPIQRWARETGYFEFEDLLTDLYIAQSGREIRNGRTAAEKEVAGK